MQKLKKKDYDVDHFDYSCDNDDEISDVLSKCNDIDEYDQTQLFGQLSNFDKKVKEYKEFNIQKEILEGTKFK